MSSAYANSPKYAAAGQRSAPYSGARSLPTVQNDHPRRVGWIIAVPLTAFVAGIALGATLAVGVVRLSR